MQSSSCVFLNDKVNVLAFVERAFLSPFGSGVFLKSRFFLYVSSILQISPSTYEFGFDRRRGKYMSGYYELINKPT